MSLISTLTAPEASYHAGDFLLQGPDAQLLAKGRLRDLAQGPLADLATRAAAHFAQGAGGPPILVGANPYAPDAMDALYQPESLSRPKLSQICPPVRPVRAIRPEPDRDHFARAVNTALAQIAAGDYDKIVLSRSLRLELGGTCDLSGLLSLLLRDPLITGFACPLPADDHGPRNLLGATPELLIAKSGDQVLSHPLAGSARRQSDHTADQAAGQGLLQSDKDLREHKIAAEWVLDMLAPYCKTLSAPEGVALHATAQMWHLGTRIAGRLKDRDTPCALLLAALHPTPAVCGLPAVPAARAIPTLEGYDRGFYAGAVGWLDGQGDGRWYLSLRCAQVQGAFARLYAGAGVVRGSTPEAELAETQAKFSAMLGAFGLSAAADSPISLT